MVVADGVDAGASRAADPPGKVCGGPAEVQRGSDGPVITGGKDLQGGGSHWR